MQALAPISPDAFNEIIDELKRRPIEMNKYRGGVGDGRSQAFGIVNRRCLPPDLSRQCFRRPRLYALLCEFADRYVGVEWDACTVNQNFRAAPHVDKGNCGLSYIVAFGDYEEGELVIEGKSYNIKHNPLLFDGSRLEHSVKPFLGERFSLVFYRLDREYERGPRVQRTQYRPVIDEETHKWVITRLDSDSNATVVEGLPHPLRGRVKTRSGDS